MSQQTPLLADHYYPIYNRGDNAGNLFFEEHNYQYFFKLYIQYIFPIAKTYAYCLMKNHLLVSMRPRTDLSGFKNQIGLKPHFHSIYLADIKTHRDK